MWSIENIYNKYLVIGFKRTQWRYISDNHILYRAQLLRYALFTDLIGGNPSNLLCYSIININITFELSFKTRHFISSTKERWQNR